MLPIWGTAMRNRKLDAGHDITGWHLRALRRVLAILGLEQMLEMHHRVPGCLQ
jgi:hypothetical protein